MYSVVQTYLPSDQALADLANQVSALLSHADAEVDMQFLNRCRYRQISGNLHVSVRQEFRYLFSQSERLNRT